MTGSDRRTVRMVRLTQLRHWWQRLQAVTRTGHFYSFRFGSQPSRGKALRLVRSERRSKQVVDSLRYVCVSGGVEQPAYIKGSDPQWSLQHRGHPAEFGSFVAILNRPGRRDDGAWRWLAAAGMTKEAALLLFNSVPVTASTICRISIVCAQARIEAE